MPYQPILVILPEKSYGSTFFHVTTAREGCAGENIQVKVWGEKGRTFRWIWRVSSGDVDFGIRKDGEMVYPTFRITTEFHPEIGSMECKETGDYAFFFDNSHGKVWSKDVSYKISLE
ncbi:Emp24/gp25L/p24 family protein [Ancylostoma duodenale]|uniref:Emp24/gp25L/p24 family protein n=1 Tax=Ancylostoma duodenale TaxID=51022 RepID=A0A0C2FQ39_9BILA|nr:Emp24/gp25L/p24 family protein [Ancylostoma duodenale]